MSAPTLPLIADQVAEEVRALLGRRRLSASALATRMGVTQRYISRRLTGETPLDVNDLAEIAAALDVTITDLIPRDGFSIGRRQRKMRTSAYALTRVIDRDRPQTSASRPSTYGAKTRPTETRQGAFTRRRGAAV
jgi:transcriptional regulator with XRE-family HTH domain